MTTLLAEHPLAVEVGLGGLVVAVLLALAVKWYFKKINSDTPENDWM